MWEVRQISGGTATVECGARLHLRFVLVLERAGHELLCLSNVRKAKENGARPHQLLEQASEQTLLEPSLEQFDSLTARHLARRFRPRCVLFEHLARAPWPVPPAARALARHLARRCRCSYNMEVTTCLTPSSSKFGCLYDFPQSQLKGHGHGCFFRFPGKTRALVPVSSASSTSVSNGYVGPGSLTQSQTNTNRNYTRSGSCLVIPPPAGKKPRAIIKFLGGAFIGAVPEVTYSYLTELLAKEGYLVISVPYNVTFDHVQAAHQVYERFNSCLDTILASGLPNADLLPAQLAELPVFSVGHSNGALLQVLSGSYFSDKIPKANAIIAYNNRPATEAVPYFEQLGPLVSQMIPIVEASPVPSMARTASGDAWKALVDAAGAVLPDNEKEALNSFTKFVDQLPSVLNEVTQGTSEFKPTPSENREFFKCSYNVKHTLLVKFNFDGIDETDTLEETLMPRVEAIGGTLEKVEISGNHITPCFQEPKWQVGALYTPADAIAQSLKTLSLNDVRVLSRTIVDWFRRFED